MLKRSIAVAFAIVLLLAWVTPVIASTHEVGTLNTGTDPLGKNASAWCRLGQRLTIPGRYVSEIGYCVWREGFPTGDIIFAIHNATSDEQIVRIVWGDAGDLGVWPQDSGKFTKVTLDEPVWINGEVKLFVEFNGGDPNNYCWAGYVSGDKFPGESYVNYFHYGQWHDIGEAEEAAYFYAWVDPGDLRSDFVFPMWALAPIGLGICSLWFYVSKKQAKRHEES
jgi:hypothetical protein